MQCLSVFHRCIDGSSPEELSLTDAGSGGIPKRQIDGAEPIKINASPMPEQSPAIAVRIKTRRVTGKYRKRMDSGWDDYFL